MKNITLSADEKLIRAARARARARARAQSESTTLNAQFRNWPLDYVGREQQAAEAMATVRQLQGRVRVGHKLTRDEMNER